LLLQVIINCLLLHIILYTDGTDVVVDCVAYTTHSGDSVVAYSS